MYNNINLLKLNMESYSSIINLLWKLSNNIHILRFYGLYFECELLMTRLWKATWNIWQKNKGVYIANIKSKRPKLIYHRYFDKEIKSFLQSDNNYRKYELIIKTTTKNNFYNKYTFKRERIDYLDCFMNFLNDVKSDKEVKFRRIYFYCYIYYLSILKSFLINYEWISSYLFFQNKIYTRKVIDTILLKREWNTNSLNFFDEFPANKLIIDYLDLKIFIHDHSQILDSVWYPIKQISILNVPSQEVNTAMKGLIILEKNLKFDYIKYLQLSDFWKINLIEISDLFLKWKIISFSINWKFK